MPGKKGKKGKKKKSKKKKVVGNETPEQVMRRFLKTYERNCAASETLVCPGLKKALKAGIEADSLLTKFLVEPVPPQNREDPFVSIEPLVSALRQERYIYLNHLFIWDLPLNHENVASLALLIEKGFYPLKQLELSDCLIEAYPLRRLALFGDGGCKGLCDGLVGNRFVTSVSMNYCDLTSASGKPLGKLVSTTAVRELYLDGNNLECKGAMEIIKICADKAESEAFEREEEARIKVEEEALAAEKAKERRFSTHIAAASDGEKSGDDAEKPASAAAGKGGKKKKKKKGKKKKKKGPPPPPPVGPWLHKLHLADNGIDALGQGGSFAPLICMRLFRKLIAHSKCLEEIDLEDNLIGDLGGREAMEALQDRKDAKLPSIKLRTTHRMTPNVFNTLVKLGAGLKKKKKRKSKKKKK